MQPGERDWEKAAVPNSVCECRPCGCAWCPRQSSKRQPSIPAIHLGMACVIHESHGLLFERRCFSGIWVGVWVRYTADIILSNFPHIYQVYTFCGFYKSSYWGRESLISTQCPRECTTQNPGHRSLSAACRRNFFPLRLCCRATNLESMCMNHTLPSIILALVSIPAMFTNISNASILEPSA